MTDPMAKEGGIDIPIGELPALVLRGLTQTPELGLNLESRGQLKYMQDRVNVEFPVGLFHANVLLGMGKVELPMKILPVDFTHP